MSDKGLLGEAAYNQLLLGPERKDSSWSLSLRFAKVNLKKPMSDIHVVQLSQVLSKVPPKLSCVIAWSVV